MKTDTRSSRQAWCAVAAALAVVLLACNFGGITVQLWDEPTPTGVAAAEAGRATECLPGILPGKTTRQEVLARLGNPLATRQESGAETLSYASAVYGQLNSVVIRTGMVVLVTVIQPEEQPLAWSAVKKQSGEPGHMGYTNYAQGSRVYAYPDLGRAYIADEAWDAVFIQQCLVPMTLDSYMLLYGNFLPKDDPFVE